MRRASFLSGAAARAQRGAAMDAQGRLHLSRGAASATSSAGLLHRRILAANTNNSFTSTLVAGGAPFLRPRIVVRQASSSSSSSSSDAASAGTEAGTAAGGKAGVGAEGAAPPAKHIPVREELIPQQVQYPLLVAADESLSINPEDYAFDEEGPEEKWERMVGLYTRRPSYEGRTSTSLNRTEQRLVEKFGIERTGEYIGDSSFGEDEDGEGGHDTHRDNTPSIFSSILGPSRRSSAPASYSEKDQQGGEEEEEEGEREREAALKPHERRRRAREQERDSKWEEIAAPLRGYTDVERQINANSQIPSWYPSFDEYEGDGYDDYSQTLQTSNIEDSPYHQDYEYNERDFKHHFSFNELSNTHIMNVGRHTKTTKGGRIFSFSATVIDGNGEGRAGWGYGKGPTLSDAVIAAQKDCEKNSFYIDRYKGSMITESISYSYKKCTVELFALPEGRIYPVSSQVMQLVFNAFGIKYIAGKWRGSTNKTKRIKTLFMALRQIEHPEFQSEKLGMKLFKPRKIPRKHGRIWTYD